MKQQATLHVYLIADFNRLPRPHHPLFDSVAMIKATDDGLFISLRTPEQKKESAWQFLESVGGKNIEILSEE